MAGGLFLDAIGQTASQGAAQGILGNMANQGISNYMSLATPTLGNGILSSLSGLGGKVWDLVGSQQGTNTLSSGANMFGAFNQYNQGQKMNKILKSQEARAADAYARDKEAAGKRQLLNF